jgi:hypothetical protein
LCDVQQALQGVQPEEESPDGLIPLASLGKISHGARGVDGAVVAVRAPHQETFFLSQTSFT